MPKDIYETYASLGYEEDCKDPAEYRKELAVMLTPDELHLLKLAVKAEVRWHEDTVKWESIEHDFEVIARACAERILALRPVPPDLGSSPQEVQWKRAAWAKERQEFRLTRTELQDAITALRLITKDPEYGFDDVRLHVALTFWSPAEDEPRAKELLKHLEQRDRLATEKSLYEIVC